ncbi:MAG: tRNA dimethylallyltransferase [Candidatus Aureabacteria bacterium]|nr:tRNA dimethylallyltransferase [Candidatus Auribacterota bacterium]
MIGLRRERDDLYRRIDARVEEMFRSGLVEETRRLQAEGADRAAAAGKALGYREVEGYLRGEYSGEEAKKRLAANTRHFARRQLIWWRRDERIRWIPVAAEEKPEETADRILQIKLQTTNNKA